MKKSFFLLLLALPLFSLTCGNIEVKWNRSKLSFYHKNKILFKKVTFNTPIVTTKCFYDKYVAITTNDAIFLSTIEGKLLEKKYFTQKHDFLYATKDTLFFIQNGYFLSYKISKNGKVTTTQIVTDTTKKPLFIWPNKGKNIIFYDYRYEKNENVTPIVTLFISNESLYYLNIKDGQIYKTTPYAYKEKVSKLPPHPFRNKEAFLSQFSKFDQNQQIALFKTLSMLSLRREALFILLKGKQKNSTLINFIDKLVKKEGIKNYYSVLKQSQWIKVPYFGKFTEQNLSALLQKLKKFQDSFDYYLFSHAGKFTCKEQFAKESHPERYRLICSIDRKKIFEIEEDGKCHKIKHQKKVLKRYKGFLTFTTVIYSSMYELDDYVCQIQKNSAEQIKYIYKHLPLSKPKHLTLNWKYTKKHLLYDIDSKQTSFGKTLQEVFSGSQKCFNISQECSKNCKFKNDENGFFIFSSSDQEKCKSRCNAARYDCDHRKMTKVKEDICQAKCIGYNKGNGGLFHSSDYDKCMDKCLSD